MADNSRNSPAALDLQPLPALGESIAIQSPREDAMTITQFPVPDTEQLLALLATLTAQVEQLHEENAQLRAAIEIYREVVRRSTGSAMR